jgi:tripartite-type tricarboxylate transporter receptor subunit TctC
MQRQSCKRGLVFSVLLTVSILCSQVVQAAEYPTKQVLLINPVGAGGSHDLTGRAIASVAATYLGQPLIVQLKPGGSGSVGSEFVAKAAPDGCSAGERHVARREVSATDDPTAVCRINHSSSNILSL